MENQKLRTRERQCMSFLLLLLLKYSSTLKFEQSEEGIVRSAKAGVIWLWFLDGLLVPA